MPISTGKSNSMPDHILGLKLGSYTRGPIETTTLASPKQSVSACRH